MPTPTPLRSPGKTPNRPKISSPLRMYNPAAPSGSRPSTAAPSSTTAGPSNIRPSTAGPSSARSPPLPPAAPKPSTSSEDGKWICCKCHTYTPIHGRPGEHPLGALSCSCPHKPCEDCKFIGNIKSFAPIVDPLPVAVSETDSSQEHTTYGVICGMCGLSWQARQVKAPAVKPEKTMYSHLNSSFGKLRRSTSLMSLRSNRSNSPGESSGGGADSKTETVNLQFAGLECSCGGVSTSDTCCFKMVKEKGHQKPVLKVQNVRHPNPLRSNAVKPEDLM